MQKMINKLIRLVYKKSEKLYKKSTENSAESILKLMLIAFKEGLESGICNPLSEMKYDSQELTLRVYFNTPSNHATIELRGPSGASIKPLIKYDLTPPEVIGIFEKVKRTDRRS